MNRQEIMNKFYTTECNEDERFLSNHGRIEYYTTLKYINDYIEENDKILEVGAGTGRYSLYFADKGYDVTSIEYVKHNLDILKSKIKPGMNIKAELGDAIDLSRFPDNTFDKTLVFGPLYHLFTKEDIDKAISEAIRVTKSKGLIYLAYLTDDSIMLSYVLKKGHILDEKKAYTEDFRMTIDPEEFFRSFYVDEFKEMMDKYDVDYIKQVATDGMSHQMKDYIDNLSEEEFDVWMKYHLKTCERHDLQGYSNHMLYFGRKR
jgi:ubiquinone/menaquinone biosynthesis C-methylase UbiE